MAAIAPVIDPEVCRSAYGNNFLITDSMFCAGNSRANACAGDAGGPAVIDNALSGIISHGEDCIRYPTVFTNVYRYRKWIAKMTGLKL